MKWRVLIIVVLVFFFTNLQNHNELDDLSIVSSIGIDSGENRKYNVSVQVMNSKKAIGGTEKNSSVPSIAIYDSEGDTIQEALRNITKEIPKKLHLANLGLLIISENVAKESIENVLDFFLRNTDVNNEFYVVVSKENCKSKDCLKILTQIEDNPTLSIKNSLETYFNYEASAVCLSASKVLDIIMKDYTELVLSSIELIGDAKEGSKKESLEEAEVKNKVVISNLAFFERDKLKGYLEKDDAKIYNLLNKKMKNSIISCEYEGNILAFEIVDNSVKYKIRKENDRFVIDYDVKIIANLTEATLSFNISNLNNLDLLEKIFRKKMEDMINSYLQKVMSKCKLDISGFGELIYKKYGNEFTKNNDNYLEKILININMNVSLENEGSELITK